MNLPHDRFTKQTPARSGRGFDATRLIVLGATFLVLVVFSMWLRSVVSRPRPAADPSEAARVVEGDRPEPARIPTARPDPAILAAVRDADLATRLTREPAVHQHLLGEARKLADGDLEALGAVEADASAVLADPASWRGRALIARGVLDALETAPDTEPREIRGLLRAPNGQRYRFAVLEAAEPPAIGQFVKVEGFFFKRCAVETAPGEYDENVLSLVGRWLVPSAPLLPPNSDLGAIRFDSARDADLEQMVAWPSDVVMAALNWVETIGSSGIAELPVEPVEYESLWSDPQAFRGRHVRVIGDFHPALEWRRRYGKDGENELGRREFHEGLVKVEGGRQYRFVSPDPLPPEIAAAPGRIALDGIFVKKLAWQNARGDIVSGPLLVATGFSAAPDPNRGFLAELIYGIAGLLAVCVVFFLFGIYSDQSEAAAFQRAWLRRKKQRLGLEREIATARDSGASQRRSGRE